MSEANISTTVQPFANFILGAGIATATHPMTMAKVLIQVNKTLTLTL